MVKLFSYFALLLIFAFIIMPAQAQTGLAGSSWPNPRHDVQLTGRAAVIGPNQPILQWTLRLGSGPLIAPTIGSDGTIYVPGNVNDTLYAVSPAGRLLWTFTGKKLEQEEFVALAVVGRDSVIYFGSTQNIFYAVNPNGKLRWSLKLEGAVRYAANIGNDGTIYVAAKDCRLYAITPAGKIKWKFNLPNFPGNGPALASDGTIYVVAGEWLQGFGPDGTRRLKVNCADLGTLTGLMIDDFELIYVTGEAPRVAVISNSAADRWGYDFPAGFGAPRLPGLAKDRSAYFVGAKSGEIFVLNPDGTKRWSRKPGTVKFLTELVLDGANQLYAVDDNKGLIAMNAAGQMRWNLPEVHCQFSPAFGPDGTIYIASDKKLYAISARAPKLAVDTAALDLGEACIGNAATQTINISNTGSADLRVNNVSVLPVSFQAEPASFILRPGARQAVQVKFLPTDFAAYAGILTIESDSGNVTVALKGAGIGAKIAAVSAALQFGDVALSKSITQLAQVANAGACEVRIDSIKTFGAFTVEAANVPQILTKGDTAEFVVRFAPANLDTQHASLLVYNSDKRNNPLVVPLWGNGAASLPEIEVAPLALEFDKTCQERQLYTVVSNAGYLTLRVDSLVFSNSAFSTKHDKSFTVAPGSHDTVRVSFKPATGVESNGTLAIFNNDPDERTVAVKLRGAGGIPDIAGLPEIDFGAVDVQTCAGLANFSERTYAIRNAGTCELRLDSLTAAGGFSLAAPFAAAQTIPAGGSLNVSLKFTPIAPGEQTGKLRIVSSDPKARSFAVILRGRGTAAPDIAVLGDTIIDFGAVSVNERGLAAVKIRNVGELNLEVTSFVVSSSRFTVAARQLALACKQDTAVVIAFAPDSMGVFAATLTIRSNDPDEAAVIIFLRGRGTPLVQPLIVAAAEYRFPALCLGSRDSLRVVITNTGNGTLTVDSLRLQGNRENFSIATAGFSLTPQQSKALWVFFKPIRATEYTATVQIFSNAGNGRVFAFGLHGGGIGPKISGSSALAFAPTKKDSARRESYLVSNLGKCSLNITSVTIAGEQAFDFKVIDKGLPVIEAGSTSTVVLQFQPTGTSARQAKLVILSSDPAQPRLEIALSGNGDFAPGKLAGPTSINFGTACFGTNVPRTCTLTNTGESDFRIIGVPPLKGGLFKISVTLQLPIVLRAGNALSIPLSFSPNKPGAFSDTLLVQTDLTATPLLRVALNGAGSENIARLTFSHQALAFNGHLDEPKTELMKITNDGCGRIEVVQIELARKLRVFAIRPQSPLPAKLEPEQSLNVLVSFTGDDFRAFADSLYIYCLDWQQNRERLSVSLQGKVTEGDPCLQVPVAKLDFGEVAVGQLKRLDLEAANCSADSRIVVRAIQPASGDFKILPDTLTIFPRNPQFFSVNFAPRRNGEIVDTLKFVYHTFSAPGQTQTTKIVLRGAGTGTGNRAFAMPNAFTPNGDGKNDAAKIHYAGYDPSALVLRVYDLRGLEVRLLRPQSRARDGEFEIEWDGRDDRGALQMPGAYLWLLENGGKKIGSGQVVLIR